MHDDLPGLAAANGANEFGRRAFAALSAVGVLAGCGFIGRPSTTLPATLADASAEGRGLQPPPSGALVVLSYPSRFAPGAEQAAREAHRAAHIGTATGGVSYWPEGFDLMMAKTAWLSAELYRELSQRLPPGQVILRPAEIVTLPGGGLASQLVDGELPAVLRVEFLAYATPQRHGMTSMPMEPRTLGRFMSPLLAVSTSHAASPTTNGALAGLDRLPPLTVADGAQPSVFTQFAEATSRRPAVSIPTSTARPAATGRYLSLPLVEFEFDSAEWAYFAADPDHRPSPARRTLAPYAAMIVEFLRSIDQAAALRAQQRTFQAVYDPTAVAADPQPARARILERFADAERQFLHQVGAAHAELVSTGDFARAMVARTTAEDEATTRAIRAAYTGAALVLAGGMTNMAAGNMPLSSSVWSTFNQTNDTTRSIVSAHDHAFQGADRSRRAVVIDIGEGERTLTASTLGTLRAQLRAILSRAEV